MTHIPRSISVQESGAFIEQFILEPTGSGPLDGLKFASKDIIDIAGRVTGCGNPRWRETHPPAACHAVCVEQLLAAGARCIGKTITDELAFSLLGENHFYGTPLNPKAPERVPGGSSCGSASAVACGLVDFALGTDTGGSVRVPASNCGIYGYRPSQGFISVAGVMPFAPTFDTVGVLAQNGDVLTRAAGVLLGSEVPAKPQVGKVHLIREAFDLCDPDVIQALQAPLGMLKTHFGDGVRETSIHAIDGESAETSITVWYERAYRDLQWSEIWSSLGSWIQQARPEFGPVTTHSFEMVKNRDRRSVGEFVRRREDYFQKLLAFLEPGDFMCIPTAPTPAPVKGTVGRRDQDPTHYYKRALALTSIAGVGRLPQVTLPLGEVNGAPLGISLLAEHGRDLHLLSVVQDFTRSMEEHH